jgi:hypothetical protein
MGIYESNDEDEISDKLVAYLDEKRADRKVSK